MDSVVARPEFLLAVGRDGISAPQNVKPPRKICSLFRCQAVPATRTRAEPTRIGTAANAAATPNVTEKFGEL